MDLRTVRKRSYNQIFVLVFSFVIIISLFLGFSSNVLPRVVNNEGVRLMIRVHNLIALLNSVKVLWGWFVPCTLLFFHRYLVWCDPRYLFYLERRFLEFNAWWSPWNHLDAESSGRKVRHSRAAVKHLIRDHFAHSVPSDCHHHTPVILV